MLSSLKRAMESRKESEKEGVVKPSKRFRRLVKGQKKPEVGTSTLGTGVSDPPPAKLVDPHAEPIHLDCSITTEGDPF
ncbi:unnamed protein product [Ilex paraguariensis]|uniref:Uncharacterized protein n=1 Tax=Ilex paraguariensis TaxID=185542 RepID=A0ABC8TDT7_9AQUA